LTGRELEVPRLLAARMSSQRIAHDLVVWHLRMTDRRTATFHPAATLG
jgi:hypothetical protein